jgi:hypothetical protein
MANDTKHGVRSYPLKDRAGNPVANSFLVSFEEAKNGAYNDYVFVLRKHRAGPVGASAPHAPPRGARPRDCVIRRFEPSYV